MTSERNYAAGSDWLRLLSRRLSRRRLIQLGALGTVGAAVAAYLGCEEEEKPAATPTATATATPTGTVAVPTGLEFLNELFDSPPDAGQGLTFALGAILPISGPGSFYGEFQGKGAALGVKQVQEAFGLKINYTVKDHKSGDTTAGATAARELATQQRVPAMLSSYGAVLGSILPVIAEFKIWTLDGGGGTFIPALKGQPYFWGTRSDTPQDAMAGAFEYAAQKLPEARRVAHVVWDVGDETINAWTETLRAAVSPYGMEVVAIEKVPIGGPDYSTTLARLKDVNPDIVWATMWGSDNGLFMKQYVEAGLTGQVIGAEFTADAAEIAGSAYDRYWFAADFFDASEPENPWSQFFIETYRQEYGHDPEFYSANFYEKPFIVWEVIKRVLAKGGDITSGEQLQEAFLENLTFFSVWGGDANTVGTMTIDPNTHEAEKPMVIGGVQGGKPVKFAKLDSKGITELLVT